MFCSRLYFRYSHVLYRITTLEKSERFDSLPHNYINGTPPQIFFQKYSIFFEQAISQNKSKPLIVKGSYLLRMSNDYCFRRAAQGQLSQCNRGNTVSVLRAVAKSRKDLKGVKVLACRCSGSNLKNFSKLTGKSPCWSSFIVKLQPGRAY